MDAAVDQPKQPALMLFAAQEYRGQRRRKRERVEGRDRDGKCNGEGELLVENACCARKERDRHKDGNEHQRSGDDGAGDLCHGHGSCRVGIGVIFVDMALDVFDHDDGIVHHQTGSQRDAEHGQRIDGKIKNLDEGEGADQRDREW